jgi:predicted ArsR family transcriptional regulator
MMKINAYSQAQMIKMLLDGPATCQDLAEATGLHYVTVYQYTRELRRAGAAYISAWEKDSRGRDVIKVYKLGSGKDAKRERMTGAERQARTRERKKAAQMNAVLGGAASFVQSANGRMRFEVAA